MCSSNLCCKSLHKKFHHHQGLWSEPAGPDHIQFFLQEKCHFRARLQQGGNFPFPFKKQHGRPWRGPWPHTGEWWGATVSASPSRSSHTQTHTHKSFTFKFRGDFNTFQSHLKYFWILYSYHYYYYYDIYYYYYDIIFIIIVERKWITKVGYGRHERLPPKVFIGKLKMYKVWGEASLSLS